MNHPQDKRLQNAVVSIVELRQRIGSSAWIPHIKSKSLGAPGSSCGATVSGRARDFARRTRFFGLRRVEAISLVGPMCNQELEHQEQDRAHSRNRVFLICAGAFVHQFSKNTPYNSKREQTDMSDSHTR